MACSAKSTDKNRRIDQTDPLKTAGHTPIGTDLEGFLHHAHQQKQIVYVIEPGTWDHVRIQLPHNNHESVSDWIRTIDRNVGWAAMEMITAADLFGGL